MHYTDVTLMLLTVSVFEMNSIQIYTENREKLYKRLKYLGNTNWANIKVKRLFYLGNHSLSGLNYSLEYYELADSIVLEVSSPERMKLIMFSSNVSSNLELATNLFIENFFKSTTKEIESFESIGKLDLNGVESYLKALDLDKFSITKEAIQFTGVKSYLNGEYVGIYRVYVPRVEIFLDISRNALYQASLCHLVDLLQSSSLRKMSSCLNSGFKQFLTSENAKQNSRTKRDIQDFLENFLDIQNSPPWVNGFMCLTGHIGLFSTQQRTSRI